MKNCLTFFCILINLSCSCQIRREENIQETSNYSEQRNRILHDFYDSLRCLTLFYMADQPKEFDEYKNTKPGTKILTCMEVECENCCSAYKRVIDTTLGSSVYFFKKDCGDEGFANSQYLFNNGRLAIVRNFVVMKAKLTDTIHFMASIEERIYDFKTEKVIIQTRQKKIKSEDKILFNNEKFVVITSNKTKVLLIKIKEFKRDINIDGKKVIGQTRY